MMGIATVRSAAADLRTGRGPRTDPARQHPGDPGSGVRRRMGRRRHDGVRTRHGGSAAGSPRSRRRATRWASRWPNRVPRAAPLDSDWSWRIPFLASSVLIVVGLFVRMRLSESPEFEHGQGRRATSSATHSSPSSRGLAKHPAGDRIACRRVCAYYLTATYLLSYITKRNPDDRTMALTGVVIASVIAVGTTLLPAASPTASAADACTWPAACWPSRSASRCT